MRENALPNSHGRSLSIQKIDIDILHSPDLFSADGPTELSDMGKLGLRRR